MIINVLDWKSYDLSNDHKPNLGLELERIKLFGGRVEPYKGKFFLI